MSGMSAFNDKNKLKESFNIKLVHVEPDIEDMWMKVRKTTRFQSIFNHFATKVGQDVTNLRFAFDGSIIYTAITPFVEDIVSMEEGAQINIFSEQNGN